MRPDADPTKLHGAFRERLRALNADLAREGLPLALYEGWRSPVRQAELYARGRVAGFGTLGKKVTRARAFESLHQWGLAADYVFRINGQWSWVEPERGAWQRYQAMAMALDLEPLSFEKPHIQLAGLKLSELRAGNFPAGGGEEFEAVMYDAITAWGGSPKTIHGIVHPPAPLWTGEPVCDLERPEMESDDYGVVR